MQLRGPLVGPDRLWFNTLLKGTVRETLASYGSVLESRPYLSSLTNGSSNPYRLLIIHSLIDVKVALAID